jgi:hypothetical protein
MGNNYRMMRWRQQFWAIMDCDEKGRPKTMEPVFHSKNLNEVKAKLAELTPSPLSAAQSDSTPPLLPNAALGEGSEGDDSGILIDDVVPYIPLKTINPKKKKE